MYASTRAQLTFQMWLYKQKIKLPFDLLYLHLPDSCIAETCALYSHFPYTLMLIFSDMDMWTNTVVFASISQAYSRAQRAAKLRAQWTVILGSREVVAL